MDWNIFLSWNTDSMVFIPTLVWDTQVKNRAEVNRVAIKFLFFSFGFMTLKEDV